MPTWRQLEQASVYRIKGGHSFLLYEEGEGAMWRESRSDKLLSREIPYSEPPPWDLSLRLLGALAEGERVVA